MTPISLWTFAVGVWPVRVGSILFASVSEAGVTHTRSIPGRVLGSSYIRNQIEVSQVGLPKSRPQTKICEQRAGSQPWIYPKDAARFDICDFPTTFPGLRLITKLHRRGIPDPDARSSEQHGQGMRDVGEEDPIRAVGLPGTMISSKSND